MHLREWPYQEPYEDEKERKTKIELGPQPQAIINPTVVLPTAAARLTSSSSVGHRDLAELDRQVLQVKILQGAGWGDERETFQVQQEGLTAGFLGGEPISDRTSQ